MINSDKGFAIAIDGPVGVGKSTTARLVAEKLGMTYIDTGAMYRAVALHQIELGAPLDDEKQLREAVKCINISLSNINGALRVYLNGRDVTDAIRTQDVANGSSMVAQHISVRERLVALQREMAAGKSVVMDGRDIGSNVLPNADVKIYLDADIKTRAARRTSDLEEKGFPAEFQDILNETLIRDDRDKTRENSPLIRTEDAVYIDTGHMSALEVAREIIRVAEQKGVKPCSLNS